VAHGRDRPDEKGEAKKEQGLHANPSGRSRRHAEVMLPEADDGPSEGK
jgi:hypothetical protein